MNKVAIDLLQSRTQRDEKIETFLWRMLDFEVRGDHIGYLGVRSQLAIAEERRSLDDTYRPEYLRRYEIAEWP